MRSEYSKLNLPLSEYRACITEEIEGASNSMELSDFERRLLETELYFPEESPRRAAKPKTEELEERVRELEAKIERATSGTPHRNHVMIANEEAVRVFARRQAEEAQLPEAFRSPAPKPKGLIPSESSKESRMIERSRLRDLYLAPPAEKIKILDVCWAAKQRYREWTRWIGGELKDGTTADRAFRAVLGSGQRPEVYRLEPRPKNWK